MPAQTLRGYQTAAIDKIRAGFAEGHTRQVLVLPTGGGKTTVAAYMIQQTLAKVCKANTVLFLAHRTELIDQCSARLDQNGITAHGVIQGNHHRKRPHAPVQVASVQTLANRKPFERPPALIIPDECHRTIGAQQNHILRVLYPSAYVIGLTATPWRLDGLGLGQFDREGKPTLFSKMVLGATYSELIAQGSILDPRVCCPFVPDLARVKLAKSGDYDEDAIAALVDRPQTIRDIVVRWKELGGNRRTVAFAASVEHSRHITEAFLEAGIPAEHLDGTTDEDLRRDMLRRLATGETRIIVNFGVLTEGWDCPSVAVCILARPTTSLSLYMQCVGRVLRPDDTKQEPPLVLDFAGCVLRHGWPTADREWSLEDREVESRGGGGGGEDDEIGAVGMCPACLFARPTSQAGEPCPNCGALPSAPKAKPVDTRGRSGVDMVEVSRDEVAAIVRPPEDVERRSPARRAFAAPPRARRERNFGGRWGA